MDDARCLDVHVDYGNMAGYFVRIDVELPVDALYEARRDDEGPMGWLGVTADEADALVQRLSESARKVREL
jgi:hypothetical protein